MRDFLPIIIGFIKELPLLLKCVVVTVCIAIEYIFPIFPGDTIVILAGFLNAQDALGLFEISISVVFGSLIGAFSAYQLGQLLSKSHLKYAWIKKLVSSPMFIQFNFWYQKWGSLFLLINRFIPGIRALFFVAAGFSNLPLFKVMILGGISAIFFNGCLVLLGYWLGFNAELILQFLYRYSIVFYVIISLFIAVSIYIYFKKRRH